MPLCLHWLLVTRAILLPKPKVQQRQKGNLSAWVAISLACFAAPTWLESCSTNDYTSRRIIMCESLSIANTDYAPRLINTIAVTKLNNMIISDSVNLQGNLRKEAVPKPLHHWSSALSPTPWIIIEGGNQVARAWSILSPHSQPLHRQWCDQIKNGTNAV